MVNVQVDGIQAISKNQVIFKMVTIVCLSACILLSYTYSTYYINKPVVGF